MVDLWIILKRIVIVNQRQHILVLLSLAILRFHYFKEMGGLAVYIRDTYAHSIKDLRFSKCAITFNLNLFPMICFLGV